MLIKKTLISIVASLLLFPLFAHASETITLKASDEISDAIAINKAIDHVTDKVMECIDKILSTRRKVLLLVS